MPKVLWALVIRCAEYGKVVGAGRLTRRKTSSIHQSGCIENSARNCRALISFFLVTFFALEAFAATTIRVATLNVENYLSTNRMVDGIYRRDYPKPESEKEALRKIIVAVDPDILAVQEMGAEAYLIEFQRDLEHAGIEFSHLAHLEASDRKRHLTVLSKIPLVAVHRHKDLKFNYFGELETVKRGLLEIEFAVDETRWTLFNVHLKSRWTVRSDDPEAVIRRSREATAVRDSIRRRFDPETEYYLLVGDLNDYRDSRAVGALLKVGSQILMEEIPARDSRGETWTYYYRRSQIYSRVDYLLASPAFLDYVKVEGATVVDLPEMREASDHRMVYVDFEFP